MTNAEMHAIQVQHTPMLLQSTLAPVLKLLGEALVEATDRTGTGSHSHQGLGHFSDFVRTRPSDKHLGESLPRPAAHSGGSARRPACGTGPHDLWEPATPRSDLSW